MGGSKMIFFESVESWKGDDFFKKREREFDGDFFSKSLLSLRHFFGIFYLVKKIFKIVRIEKVFCSF